MKNLWLLLFTALLLTTTVHAQDNSSGGNQELYIKITKIVEGQKDTLWIELDAGANMGLQKGMKGYAAQVYRSKERDYSILNPAWITTAYNSSAVAYVLTKTDKKKDYLMEGDQVVFTILKAPPLANEYTKLLHFLASLNIQFVNVNADPIYTQYQVLKEAKAGRSDSIVAAMQGAIIETAQYLKDLKDNPKSWTDPFPHGKFKGIGLLAAMEKTSLLDVESFLQFVKTFPGKYIGRKWKISETYATWLINDMPLATDRQYILDAFLNTSSSQLPKWVRENRFYIDSTKDIIINTINQYTYKAKLDSAEWLIAKATTLSETMGDAKFMASVTNSKAYLFQIKGGNENQLAAIQLYTKALALDSLNWSAYWQRGNLYGNLERYTEADNDLKVLNRLYPDYADAWGNRGWWYLKQFRVKDAGPACLKAYELDSSSYAWSVNLAHYYLLSGQNAKARSCYKKTLENLKSESDFLNGPLSDFDFFAEHGVLSSAFEQEKAWMLQQFNDNYKHHLQSDSLFALAKEYKNQKKFSEAAVFYVKSRDAEKSAKNQQSLSIHNITTWAGYMYYQLKDYKKAEDYYAEALAMAQNNFPELIVNDMELIQEMYDAAGNKALAEAYKSQALAWRSKTTEESSESNLYVVSIGVDQYKDVNYNWASGDAGKIAEELKKRGKRFKNIYTYVLTNKNALSDSVDRTMQKIIAQAKEDDAFVFYFTGKAANKEKESFLLPYGLTSDDADSILLKKAISAPLLRSWSNSISAKHQLFLLDAAAPKFSSAFAGQSSVYSNLTQKDLVVLSATFPRIERKEGNTGVVASALLKLFADSTFNTEKVITAKRIENFFADEITRHNYFLPLESYSQGRDFVLAETNPVVQKTEKTRGGPAVEETEPVTRGVIVKNTDQSAGGTTVNKRYGLFIATDNYVDPKWPKLNNPVSDANALKKELEDEYGFEIEVLANPTYSQIVRKIDEYTRKKFDPNDQLVVLFAGHGFLNERNNTGYLIPSDATYTNLEFDRYYYSMNTLFNDLKIIPAEHMLVLVDACHGGAICDNATMRGGNDMYSSLSLDQQLRKHLERSNRIIITSARNDEQAMDGTRGKNSPFIARIIETLHSADAKDNGFVMYDGLMKELKNVMKTEPTTAKFSPKDSWNFMFFYAGKKQESSPVNFSGRTAKFNP